MLVADNLEDYHRGKMVRRHSHCAFLQKHTLSCLLCFVCMPSTLLQHQVDLRFLVSHIGLTTSTICDELCPSPDVGSSTPIVIVFDILLLLDLSVATPAGNANVIVPLYLFASPWSNPVITN